MGRERERERERERARERRERDRELLSFFSRPPFYTLKSLRILDSS
jgi:hypothetical protein